MNCRVPPRILFSLYPLTLDLGFPSNPHKVASSWLDYAPTLKSSLEEIQIVHINCLNLEDPTTEMFWIPIALSGSPLALSKLTTPQ